MPRLRRLQQPPSICVLPTCAHVGICAPWSTLTRCVFSVPSLCRRCTRCSPRCCGNQTWCFSLQCTSLPPAARQVPRNSWSHTSFDDDLCTHQGQPRILTTCCNQGRPESRPVHTLRTAQTVAPMAHLQVPLRHSAGSPTGAIRRCQHRCHFEFPPGQVCYNARRLDGLIPGELISSQEIYGYHPDEKSGSAEVASGGAGKRWAGRWNE